MNKNTFYFDLISKPNVDILIITVSMCKWYDFETNSTSNDVMNIQNFIGKVFGPIERAFYNELNAYFGPRSKNIPHGRTNYGPGIYKENWKKQVNK